MELIEELFQRYRSQGASHELLSTAHDCWTKWQAMQNEESRVAYPMVNEEFAFLTILIGLELNGFEPQILSHDEFLSSTHMRFSQVFVGHARVIVVRKPITLDTDVQIDA